MSSLYFDITKDCLYANGKNSLERRSVATVLEQVKNLFFDLNIDPDHWKGPWHHNEDNGSHPSISCRRDSCDMESWRKIHFHDPMGPIGTGFHATEDVISDLVPLVLQGPEWRDIDASKDMASLLLVRSTVLSLLERAPGAKSDPVLCLKFSRLTSGMIISPGSWIVPWKLKLILLSQIILLGIPLLTFCDVKVYFIFPLFRDLTNNEIQRPFWKRYLSYRTWLW